MGPLLWRAFQANLPAYEDAMPGADRLEQYHVFKAMVKEYRRDEDSSTRHKFNGIGFVVFLYVHSLEETRAQRSATHIRNAIKQRRPRVPMLRTLDVASSPCNVYSSLPLLRGSRQIRLLHIYDESVSGYQAQMVDCALVTVLLEDNIQYDALSYAWGDSPHNCAININGSTAYVGKNLYEAILAFRKYKAMSAWIWIDAVCINQSDELERGDQVLLMRDIFGGATNVHIWLGTAVEGSQEFFSVIKTAAQGSEFSKWLSADQVSDEGNTKQKPSINSPGSLDGLSDEGFHHVIWRLRDYQWWRRLWTLQEVAVASNPVVHWGEHTISFVLLQIAIADFAPALHHLLMYWEHTYHLGEIHNELTDLIHLANHYNTMSCGATGPFPTCDFLQGASLRLATLDHDRVYAWLGIPAWNPGVIPNYSTVIEDVYEQTTIALLQRDGGPQALAFAGLHTSKLACLPSWVVDFGNLPSTNALGALGRGEATDASDRDAGFRFAVHRKREIAFRGQIIDQVCKCSDPAPNLGSDRFFEPDERESQLLRDTLKSWLTLAGDSLDRVFELFCSLLGGISTTRNVSDLHRLHSWIRDDTNGGGRVHAELKSDLCSRMSGSRCFVTQKRHMGLASGLVEAGDVLVVFTGSPKTFIAREAPSRLRGRFQLIGQCFSYEHHKELTGVQAPNEDNARSSQRKHVFRDIILV